MSETTNTSVNETVETPEPTDLSVVMTGVTLTKVCNIKPFKGATDSKQVTLAIKYDGLTLAEVLTKASRTDVISWQNGPGRKGYDELINKSTVKVSAKAPGLVSIDPEQAMVNKLKGMTVEEREQEIAKLIALAESN